MLHKTILPLNPDELAGLVELQVQLLELAASTDQLDKAAVQHWFGKQDLVAWLTTNWPCTIGSLKSFARECPAALKTSLVQDIIAEIRHDTQFWKRYADPDFTLKFAATDRYRQPIAEWLKRLYDQFSQAGFDQCVTGGRSWSKRDWEEAFRASNPTIRTCPQCDGTMKSGLTVEHIFPREKYPPLSVHAANLIPCCGDCQDWKKNQDPIKTALPKRLFLPYWQHALEHCDVKTTENAQGSWEFVLTSREPDDDWGDAIQQLGCLYGIPCQWNKNCRDIVGIATAKIDEKIAADQFEGRDLSSKAQFRESLTKLCLVMRSQWGRQHYFVPATAWIEWARDNMLDQLWGQFGAQNPGI